MVTKFFINFGNSLSKASETLGNFIDNFIAKGKVSNFKADLFKDITLEKANFNFFADSTDILLKNIFRILLQN